MTLDELFLILESNPYLALLSITLLSLVVFLVTRGVIARGLIYLAKRTKTKYDDIIVDKLRPYRVTYIAPLLVFYLLANLISEAEYLIKQTALTLMLWVAVITLNSLISALNEIYEGSPFFTGVSIQGYLDIVKIMFILIGIILTISILTGESPVVLLSGLGAITAILMLVFRDTILSLVASIQISTNELVKEGDWIEVPSYNADGDVIDISLHTIKIQNFDKTISIIPTHKMMGVAYKNWRGMQESGGRRIKRSIHIDIATIKFCHPEMIARFQNVDLIKDYINGKIKTINTYQDLQTLDPKVSINGRQLTNIGTFRAYIEAYLQEQEMIHQEGMTFLVRQLAPGRTGLPIEIYVFTKTILWKEYENIQGDIFDHLLAAVGYFDLKVFQEPTNFILSN